jgi:S1-C subfamily serine protease
VRKFFALLVLAFCSACCTPSLASGANYPALANTLSAKTVALVVQRGGETRAFCSGVWISKTVIVTALHCVEGEIAVKFVTREDALDGAEERESVEARDALVVSIEPEADLAVLKVLGTPPKHGIANLGKAARQGQHVHTLGHPRGLWFSYSSGHVAAVRRLDTGWADCLMIQSSAPISGGNSGGGLFDDKGNLLGIAHAQRPDGQNLNFYIHVAHVRALLKATTL